MELVRKLLLCGCVRFLAPGSPAQCLGTMLFCIIYLALVAYIAPYKSSANE